MAGEIKGVIRPLVKIGKSRKFKRIASGERPRQNENILKTA